MHDSIVQNLTVPRSERMAVRDYFYRGSVLVLGGLVVGALARNSRGPGSSPGPGSNFFPFKFYDQPTDGLVLKTKFSTGG